MIRLDPNDEADVAALAALHDVRAFVAEEHARPGAGLHYAVSQVRILDYIDSLLAALPASPAPLKPGDEQWKDVYAEDMYDDDEPADPAPLIDRERLREAMLPLAHTYPNGNGTGGTHTRLELPTPDEVADALGLP